MERRGDARKKDIPILPWWGSKYSWWNEKPNRECG